MMSATHERTPVHARLGGLSRRHAGAGDVRRAQLAAWASDVHVLEELLWQNGIGEAPDPDAQLAAVGEAVASALETLAVSLSGSGSGSGELTARRLVEAAREALVTTFDESVHGLLTDRFAALDHLDLCEAGEYDATAAAADRLAGRTPDALVGELRAAAADCMAVAHLMDTEQESAAARRLADQADVAGFEAYLVAAAVLAGDVRLATVDLRWELARDLEAAEGGHPGGRRPALAGLVGSAERAGLRGVLESPPGS